MCFVNWLPGHRAKLPTHIAEKRGLLIVDGHTSRENPLALELLHHAGVNVLTLPSHMTHVLQLFDVGLASPLKQRHGHLFHAMLKKETNHVKDNAAATMRKIAVEAFTAAWDTICSKANCEAAAAVVGVFPVDKSRPKALPHVRDFSDAELLEFRAWKRRNSNRLSISGCLLTEQAKIEEIRSIVALSQRDKDLASRLSIWTEYVPFVRDIISRACSHGSRLLSPVPPIGTTRFVCE